GATDTAYTGGVSLTISSGPGGATLQGTTTATPLGGVATFNNLLLNTAGTYVLKATAAGATTGTSNQITVSPSSTVTALIITQEPPDSVQAGASFGLKVGGQDAYGNTTALTASVKVAISTNPGGATLGGTTTVTPTGGTVTFSGLSLDKVGTGYK